jgi:methionyl-tRNA synthetase
MPKHETKKFYITTAIDYPNGSPHLGHVYEKIVTDTYARWYRFLGYDVRFLTGTDENGQKLAKAAAESKKYQSTKEYIDVHAEEFRKLCVDLELTHDDFIRTTEERHIRMTQDLWTRLEQKGDIYFGRYSGWYCISCEAFYTETQASDHICPHHAKPLEFVEEDGYFFRMGQYQEWITHFIRTNESFIFPTSARREILSRLEGETLKDLSVSRPNTGWGIAVPSRQDFVIYTWFDALINYYAALEGDLSRYWPASMHVVGKDITWFHSVIWPTMLHALGIPLPKQIHVHGMLLAADGKKMSKSLNNSVDPYQLIGTYANDLIRYYLLRGVASGQDGKFGIEDLIARNNNELANDYGNLALRVIKLAEKRLGSQIERGEASQDLDVAPVAKDVAALMQACEHHRALDRIWEFIKEVNTYLNTHEPWRIKDDPKRVHHLLYNSLHAIYGVAVLLQAFIPDAAQKTLMMLGRSSDGMGGLEFGDHPFKLGATESLFPKIETKIEV